MTDDPFGSTPSVLLTKVMDALRLHGDQLTEIAANYVELAVQLQTAQHDLTTARFALRRLWNDLDDAQRATLHADTRTLVEAVLR